MTGKKLLEKGELQRRYTIIPLNKISAKTLNVNVVNSAKSLVRRLCNEHNYVINVQIRGCVFVYSLFVPRPSVVRLETITSTLLCPW